MVLPPKDKTGDSSPTTEQKRLSNALKLTSDKHLLEAACPAPDSVDDEKKHFPYNLIDTHQIFLGQDGKAYATLNDHDNPYVLPVTSRQFQNLIRNAGKKEGVVLRKSETKEIQELLQAEAEIKGIAKPVFYRVAPLPDGVEIDLGDDQHTRVQITPGEVQVVSSGSETLFYRTRVSQPMPKPADQGNLRLIEQYLNMESLSRQLFIGWLSYTLSHPKASTSNYVVLVLLGGQGSGKTSLCTNMVIPLIDPNIAGVQIMPTNPKDLAIAASNAHVLCYDNVRGFRQSMADLLCVASTGGSMTSRQLYTDDEQHIQYLHVALVLNGIHEFVNQSDLAQRALPIRMKEIPECQRKSELQLKQNLASDLPYILRGLFDLIADIFKVLPEVSPTHPQRMIEFSHWLAAMEKTYGAPAGTIQQEYSKALHQAQLDSLLENPLAEAIYEFSKGLSNGSWKGTSTELLIQLDEMVNPATQRSRDWPMNAISLSKRLLSLQASLKSQGIEIKIIRGKTRQISIINVESF